MTAPISLFDATPSVRLLARDVQVGHTPVPVEPDSLTRCDIH